MNSPESDPELRDFMKRSYEHAEQEEESISQHIDAELQELIDRSELKLGDIKTFEPDQEQLDKFFKLWTAASERLANRKEVA